MNNIHLDLEFNFDQLMKIIDQLSPDEKLELNNMMWQHDLAIPIEHQKIVLERVQKSRENPERMIDWDKVVMNK